MKILIVYQSVIDTCASFFTLLFNTVEEENGTRMSCESIYDKFVCLFWFGRQTLWCFINTSTYGLLIMACDRYAAVIYPVWYNNNVSTVLFIGSFNRTIDKPQSMHRIWNKGQKFEKFDFQSQSEFSAKFSSEYYRVIATRSTRCSLQGTLTMFDCWHYFVGS